MLDIYRLMGGITDRYHYRLSHGGTQKFRMGEMLRTLREGFSGKELRLKKIKTYRPAIGGQIKFYDLCVAPALHVHDSHASALHANASHYLA